MIEGKKFTAAEFSGFVGAMAGQAAAIFERDPKEFAKQLALLTKLANMAVADKLDENPTTQHRLNFARMQVLMSAMLEKKANDATISEDMLMRAYEQRKPQTAAARTRVLYVSFASDGKGRSEAEALKKITALRAQAAGGADFVKIVKENSDDEGTKANDGAYPEMRPTDGLPQAIKDAVFSLKPGEYSQPVRQAAGFYVFKLEKMDSGPTFEEMKQTLIGEMRQAAFGNWMNETRNKIDLKIENEDYFRPSAVAPTAIPGMPGGMPIPGRPIEGAKPIPGVKP